MDTRCVSLLCNEAQSKILGFSYVIGRLWIFVRICIFTNGTEGVEIKWSFVLHIACFNEYSITHALYIFASLNSP